jgi:hypothetical protein
VKYEHKGIEVTLDAGSGTFTANIGPTFKRFSSLAAAKKAIDTHIAEAFQPFDAICEPSWENKTNAPYIIARVIGIEKAGGKRTWNNRDKYIFAPESKQRPATKVLRDTPENRAAFIAYHEFSAESGRIKLERQKKLEELQAAIKHEELDY